MQQKNFFKIKSLLTIVFITFSLNEGMASLSFESSSTNPTTPTPAASNISKISSPQVAVPNLKIENASELGDEANIKMSLKRYELILSQEKKMSNIISLQFNRIVCFMQLARLSRIAHGGKNLVADEEKYLKTALGIIEEILKIKNIPPQVTGQMYYFKGLSYLDLGLKENARDFLEKAIVAYPDSKFVTSLSLYLADLLYDERKLPEALVAYRRFYKKMSPQEQDLADYKISWIYLNESKMDQAIDLFLVLIKRSTSQSIVQDSILSLSVALSEKFDEDFIVQKLDRAELSEERKIEILSNVYENFLKQPERPRAKIFDRILNSKISGETVVKLISIELPMVQVDKRVGTDVVNLQRIQKYLLTNKKNIPLLKKPIITILGSEIERLIAKSLKLYQQDKNEMYYKILSTSIDIYLKLDIFNRQVEVASLLMDLYIEISQNDQLMILCKEVLDNSKYKSIKGKAKLQVLLNFEKKYLTDPKTSQDKFFNLVKFYLSDPNADQWESVAQKFSDYLVKANLNTEAEEIVTRLNQKYPHYDYFLKLILIKFELKKCPEIISILASKKDLDAKLLDYKRECHLKMAQESKSSNKSFANYETSIQDFIALSSGAKKNAAIADYLSTMERDDDKSVKKKYYNLIENKFFNNRYEKEIFPIYQKEFLQYVEAANFNKALLLFTDCDKFPNCAPLSPLVDSLKQVQVLDRAKSNELVKNQKYDGEMGKYVSLVYPEIILKYIEAEDVKKYSDPKSLVVASRLAKVDWSDPKLKPIYGQVSEFLNKEEIPFTTAASWIKFGKINFPNEKSKNRLKDQDILFLMKRVQQTRPILLADLPKYSIQSQKILLTKAIETEQKMADVIKQSPIPNNLDPAKIKEYQDGINQLAEEFVVQGAAYSKSVSSLELQKPDLNTQNFDQLKVPENIEKWPWGSRDESEEKTKKLVSEEQFIQALFHLDYLLSSSKISNDDYYSRRSGILLFSAIKRNKHLPMVKYVWEECDSNKQLKLLNAWQERSKK
jgi:hypothetical protein